MTNLIAHLKSKNLITDEAQDIILNTTNDSIKETLGRSLKSKNAKYSPAMCSFSVTLQLRTHMFVKCLIIYYYTLQHYENSIQ
ncbi:Uncharacterized protein FWK35_00010071 [Aphis craccivora]|uniref:THAP9-like helix-turn-helix domain-containing protein n=1 Tax=Aphis craccivora TaxID=307492 RepID=A0A6G0YNZ5_APHCR|nr:Uncharacterized protein FWK35_00010071 [Aphis craccivora]